MARKPDRGTANPVHHRVREFFDLYTRDLRADDLQRVFTRETPEAWQLFARAINADELAALPWHIRVAEYVRRSFLAFTLRLSPARRAVYGIGLLMALVGLLDLVSDIRIVRVPLIPFVVSLPVPAPDWPPGTMWLTGGFLVLNLLILLEVADRLTLKRDLEVAREIQQAMLPREVYTEVGIEGFGMTQPANTVGGDLYDIIRRPDGRIVLALGDVAGKGSPAALLMALAVAMLRVLVDEGLEPAELAARLNGQISRHAPGSRFITLFVALYDPASGALYYVNAGQNPPMLRRVDGRYERLTEGGVALGLFEGARYAAGSVMLNPGDVLVLYSDGITEAENAAGVPFDEPGLQSVIDSHWWKGMQALGTAILDAVRSHAAGTRVADDLTVLTVRRPIPLPGAEH